MNQQRQGPDTVDRCIGKQSRVLMPGAVGSPTHLPSHPNPCPFSQGTIFAAIASTRNDLFGYVVLGLLAMASPWPCIT
jgi:hypothetical protein